MSALASAHAHAAPTIHEVGDVTTVLDVVRAEPWKSCLADFDSLLARSQSSGRGQYRRAWSSPAGNIYAALRLPMQPPFLGTEAAVALGAFLAQGLRSLGFPCLLKWPNDLVLVHKGVPCKVGGILLEEREGTLTAGIGINVSFAPDKSLLRDGAALAATSLAAWWQDRAGEGQGGCSPNMSAGGSTVGTGLLDTELAADFAALARSSCTDATDPEAAWAICPKLWKRLVNHLFSTYSSRSAPSIWQAAACDLLLWRNRMVVLVDGDVRVAGRLCGLGSGGELILSAQDGTRSYLSGSLELLS